MGQNQQVICLICIALLVLMYWKYSESFGTAWFPYNYLKSVRNSYDYMNRHFGFDLEDPRFRRFDLGNDFQDECEVGSLYHGLDEKPHSYGSLYRELDEPDDFLERNKGVWWTDSNAEDLLMKKRELVHRGYNA